MSIATYAALVEKMASPWHRGYLARNGGFSAGSRLCSDWSLTPGFTNPTTSVALTRAAAGALGQPDAASGVQRILELRDFGLGGTSVGCGIITDRLVQHGGLSAIVTGAQTTNLPTAALPRYTSGVGVMIGLEIYTIIGATGTTVTVSYTNQAGTAGRTSVAAVLGGTNFREASRVIQLPLQQGDTGCRSVESVTLAASTGTAGNFGVTLFRPLLMFPTGNLFADARRYGGVLHAGGYMPVVEPGACLQVMGMTSTLSFGTVGGQLLLGEE